VRKRVREEYIPTPEEAAEIEAGLDEIDRGEYVTLDEMMREVRAVLHSRTKAAVGGGSE
jgi:predicted transcriptional regulator